MFGLFKKEKTQKKNNVSHGDKLSEAFEKAQIPFIYNADDGKYSYVDINGNEAISAFKTSSGYKLNGEIVSERDVYDAFKKRLDQEKKLSEYKNDQQYEIFFKCRDMMDYFSDVMPQFEIKTDIDFDTDYIYFEFIDKNNSIRLMEQKEEVIKIIDEEKNVNDEENSIASILIAFIYQKYKSYFKSGNFDPDKVDFPYRELVKQYLVCISVTDKINDIPNMEAKVIDGTTVFVMFKNGSALSHAIACKYNPSGHTIVYDYSPMETVKDNESYAVVMKYLNLPANIINKADVHPEGEENA